MEQFHYSKLKQSKNGMPMWHSFIPIIMYFANQKEVWVGKELHRAIADSIGLPQELRNLRNKKAMDNVVEKRVGWATSLLYKAGIFDRPSRGSIKLNDFGKSIYKQYGVALTEKLVKSLPKYQEQRVEGCSEKFI